MVGSHRTMVEMYKAITRVPGSRQGRAYAVQKLGEVEGLGQVIECADALGEGRGLDAAPGGHQDDARRISAPDNRLQQLQAVLAWHVDVARHHVDVLLAHLTHGFRGIRGGQRPVPRSSESARSRAGSSSVSSR